MNVLRSPITLVLLLSLSTGCSDSVLDLNPQDQVSDDAVWSDPALAKAFLFDIYRGVGHGYNGTTLWVLTDDGHNTRGGDVSDHNLSNVSPSDLQAMGGSRFSHYRWGDLYKSIRNANIFITEIEKADFPEAEANQMKGEALFLRAYFYHNLLRVFGGVPLITEVYGLNDDYRVARNSFAEVVDQIVSDLDQAAALLPLEYPASELGRITKGAALALKARVLLYAASDLYQTNPSGMPETGYTGGTDRTAYWRAAKDAAKAVIDLGIYSLYGGDASTPEEGTENYANLFLTKVNPEFIFVRYFLPHRDDIPNVGRYVGPNGYHNWGSNTPTQNLIDAYRMVDGTPFDWSNPEHAAAPYENRDPRFYASIQYDGARWVKRPADVIHLDTAGIIQTFRTLTLPDGSTLPGLDTRYGPVEDWNGTYSGYYLRKQVDPTVDHQFVSQDVPWVFIRYAEVLLNYAEASIELNELDDALWAINQIRRRSGMPELSASLGQDALREEYRNERRVELAFEEHRFFDVRRWMIAPEVMDENAHGIEITVKATDPLRRSTYYDYTYKIIDVEERHWDDRMYFLPISRDELNRNDALVQNPGY
ncbi:MAG TPA: RagB/SusD family nutrient uptake outer membrane protein [Longimicrobiaceae bacterium]